MKQQKSSGLRVILGIVAAVLGLGVQTVGALVDKFLYVEISSQYSFGVVGLLSTLLGFVIMGYFIYRWAIK